jgi:hypothetical protein
MVFLNYKVDPAKKQAKIHIALSSTPTLSLSDSNAELQLKLELRIASSTRAGYPITVCAEHSVCEVFREEDGGVDIFAQGAFGSLRSTAQEDGDSISLGLLRANYYSDNSSIDLRERGWQFITIPGDGSAATVTHKLTWDRIFKYEDRRTKSDLAPGEMFEISLNKLHLGTRWWCWGDLTTDIKDKRLHAWKAGPFSKDKPDDNFVKEGNWVLGEEPMLLDWVDVTPERKASFVIVE